MKGGRCTPVGATYMRYPPIRYCDKYLVTINVQFSFTCTIVMIYRGQIIHGVFSISKEELVAVQAILGFLTLHWTTAMRDLAGILPRAIL